MPRRRTTKRNRPLRRRKISKARSRRHRPRFIKGGYNPEHYRTALVDVIVNNVGGAIVIECVFKYNFYDNNTFITYNENETIIHPYGAIFKIIITCRIINKRFDVDTIEIGQIGENDNLVFEDYYVGYSDPRGINKMATDLKNKITHTKEGRQIDGIYWNVSFSRYIPKEEDDNLIKTRINDINTAINGMENLLNRIYLEANPLNESSTLIK